MFEITKEDVFTKYPPSSVTGIIISSMIPDKDSFTVSFSHEPFCDDDVAITGVIIGGRHFGGREKHPWIQLIGRDNILEKIKES